MGPARRTDEPLTGLDVESSGTDAQQQSDYCLNQVNNTYSSLSTFWKVVKTDGNDSSVSLPSEIKLDYCIINDQTDTRSAFNRHFAAADHISKSNLIMFYSYF